MPAYIEAHPGHPESIVDGTEENPPHLRDLVRAGYQLKNGATSGRVQ